jgi:hypothetical protein
MLAYPYTSGYVFFFFYSEKMSDTLSLLCNNILLYYSISTAESIVMRFAIFDRLRVTKAYCRLNNNPSSMFDDNQIRSVCTCVWKLSVLHKFSFYSKSLKQWRYELRADTVECVTACIFPIEERSWFYNIKCYL